MGQESDTVRAEIAGTRDDMSQTLSAIGEKVSPKQMARRQTGRVKDRFIGIRTAVMGSVENVTQSVQDTAGAAGGRAQGVVQSMQQAPQAAKTQTQGNPLAAGLIAFGLGLLVASLIPASEEERQMAARVGETAQPAVQQAQAAAQEVKQSLQSSAQDAIGEVKQAATGATQEVRDQAASSAQEVNESARQSVRDVGEQAKQSSQTATPGNHPEARG